MGIAESSTVQTPSTPAPLGGVLVQARRLRTSESNVTTWFSERLLKFSDNKSTALARDEPSNKQRSETRLAKTCERPDRTLIRSHFWEGGLSIALSWTSAASAR